MSIFPSEDGRRVSEKRKRLARVISEKNQARLRMMGDNPMIDVDPRNFERFSDHKSIERDLARWDEASLDNLLVYHDPRSAGTYGFVW